MSSSASWATSPSSTRARRTGGPTVRWAAAATRTSGRVAAAAGSPSPRTSRVPDPRELVFALEFRGRGEQVPGSTTHRRARTSAPSQTLSPLVGADGVFARVEPVAGEHATLEARVERFGDGTFVE